MLRIIAVFTVFLFVYGGSFTLAQEVEPTAEVTQEGSPSVLEVIAAMGNSQPDGLVEDYWTDPRYNCNQLEQGQHIVNSYLGLDITVVGTPMPSTDEFDPTGFFDKLCEVNGYFGAIKVRTLDGVSYLEASAISALAAYNTENPIGPIATGALLGTSFKHLPGIRYYALALDEVSEIEPPRQSVVDHLVSTEYLWTQMQVTDDQVELANEGTWHLLALLEANGENFVYLPSGHLVALEVMCDAQTSGQYTNGELFCGEVDAYTFFDAVPANEVDHLYGGIYIH
jgi:hypothetical protein